jgi:hypothetical protein
MKAITTTVLAVVLGLVASAMMPGLPARAETPTCVYLTDSGHNIHGSFMAFYLSHNGVVNFGLPLTEAFIEDGSIVQYFERARLELHADNPEPFRVQLGLLGTQFGISDPPIKPEAIPSPNNPDFRYFPDTGLLIGLTVKQYFDTHGGVDVLGYPLSLLHFENGNFVQYFQRARLEWNPADSSPNRVRTSPVGRMILDRRYPSDLVYRMRAVNDWCPEYNSASLPKGFLPAAPPVVGVPTPIPPNTILSLQVRVKFRQTGPTGPQYVDIMVSNQNSRPFAGAALFATVHFSNGDRLFPLLPSDSSGKSAFSFDIRSQAPGSPTLVDVTAISSGLSATGRDSFTR